MSHRLQSTQQTFLAKSKQGPCPIKVLLGPTLLLTQNLLIQPETGKIYGQPIDRDFWHCSSPKLSQIHIAVVRRACKRSSVPALMVTACTDAVPYSTAKPGSLARPSSQAVDYTQLSRTPDSHWHCLPFEPTLMMERVQRLGAVHWICTGLLPLHWVCLHGLSPSLMLLHGVSGWMPTESMETRDERGSRKQCSRFGH